MTNRSYQVGINRIKQAAQIRAIIRKVPKSERTVSNCQKALRSGGIEIKDATVAIHLAKLSSKVGKPGRSKKRIKVNPNWSPTAQIAEVSREREAEAMMAPTFTLEELRAAISFVRDSGGLDRAYELVNAVQGITTVVSVEL